MNRGLLAEDLERDEGFVSHAYSDSRGYLTIGIGRMVDERLGGGITEGEARYLLLNDIDRTEQELDVAMPWWRALPEPWQRGLANMAYNLGLPRLLGFRRMLAALRVGDGDLAAREALDSVWAKQVGARAERIAALFRS